jgi:hypothetical protein
MKNYDKLWRVEKISEKLKDTTAGSLLHIDFDSWSEAEKALFRKVDEIEQEYQSTGNAEVLAKNPELIYKNLEVMHRRIQELYCWTIPTLISGYTTIDREIIDCFFQQHFINFEVDFLECVKHLQTWSKRDFDEFLCNLKKYGPLLIRIPRGFNESNSKEFDENAKSKESTATEDEKQEE